MKPDRAKYGASFQIGLSHWERVDFECPVSPDEDPLEEEMKLKVLVETAHKKMNPQLYPNGSEAIVESFEPPVQQVGDRKPMNLKDDINSCKELKVLESYKFIVRGKQDLQEAYDKKKMELENS